MQTDHRRDFAGASAIEGSRRIREHRHAGLLLEFFPRFHRQRRTERADRHHSRDLARRVREICKRRIGLERPRLRVYIDDPGNEAGQTDGVARGGEGPARDHAKGSFRQAKGQKRKGEADGRVRNCGDLRFAASAMLGQPLLELQNATPAIRVPSRFIDLTKIRQKRFRFRQERPGHGQEL